jgi:hypothetical protein
LCQADCTVEARAAQIGSDKVCAVEIGPPEISTRENSLLKVGFRQIGPSKVRLCEISSFKVGPV